MDFLTGAFFRLSLEEHHVEPWWPWLVTYHDNWVFSGYVCHWLSAAGLLFVSLSERVRAKLWLCIYYQALTLKESLQIDQMPAAVETSGLTSAAAAVPAAGVMSQSQSAAPLPLSTGPSMSQSAAVCFIQLPLLRCVWSEQLSPYNMLRSTARYLSWCDIEITLWCGVCDVAYRGFTVDWAIIYHHFMILYPQEVPQVDRWCRWVTPWLSR